MIRVAGCDFPGDLHYLVDHDTWARPGDDGLVTVGITAMGIRQSGDVYMCRPKAVGQHVEAGRSIAVVELSKSIVSVKSPVGGTVVDVNPLLEDAPELVHRDPYGAGWLARLRADDLAGDLARLVHGDAVVPAFEAHARLMQFLK